jgi:hypothetical protein
MTAIAMIEPIRERLPRLLNEVSFGEDVQWEANIQLQPIDGGGMVPMVGIILIMSSPILGQEILGAAAVPLGVAQGDETFLAQLRQMWDGLCAQRSQMLGQGPSGGPFILPPTNGNQPQ